MRWACRWLLAVVFLLAGASKVTDLPAFADVVLLHSPVPYRLGVVLAAWLPWLEMTLGVCLALGYAIREAASILVVLLIGLLIYALASLGDPASCGCFVFPVRMEWLPPWWPPARNAVLLLASALLALPEHVAFPRGPFRKAVARDQEGEVLREGEARETISST